MNPSTGVNGKKIYTRKDLMTETQLSKIFEDAKVFSFIMVYLFQVLTLTKARNYRHLYLNHFLHLAPDLFNSTTRFDPDRRFRALITNRCSTVQMPLFTVPRSEVSPHHDSERSL